MNTRTDPPAATLPQNDIDLLEARLAAQLVQALRESSEDLPAGAAERLRFAREQALARARQTRQETRAVGRSGGAMVLGRFDQWWPRIGALLPVLVLSIGVMLLVDARQRDQVDVAAEIDAALLTDDLPPSAYADPGFVAFLKLQQP